MRGVVSAGMAAALERLGLTPCFDLVVGSSAGAINGAALLAGVAARAADAYCGPLASRSFVNPAGVLRGKPVIDVKDVLEIAAGLERPGRSAWSPRDRAALHRRRRRDRRARSTCTGCARRQEVWDAILASSRMPWAGGPPVEIDGRRYLDGGMASPIPVAEALAAARRTCSRCRRGRTAIPRKSASRIGDRLIVRHLRGLNPALVTLYRDRIEEYERLVDDIGRRSRDAPGGRRTCSACARRPGRRASASSSGARRAAAAAADAERLVEAALGGRRLGAAPAA